MTWWLHVSHVTVHIEFLILGRLLLNQKVYIYILLRKKYPNYLITFVILSKPINNTEKVFKNVTEFTNKVDKK